MLLTGTALWCESPVTCRLRAPPTAPPAEIMPVGSRDRGELNRTGVVIRLGVVPPTLVLANSMLPFPSIEVMGNAPPDARAGGKKKRKKSQYEKRLIKGSRTHASVRKLTNPE